MIANILRPSQPDELLIMNKLGLSFRALESDVTHIQNDGNSHSRYIFALFLLRYRILDVILWLWMCDDKKVPQDIIMRTRLPDTKSIVSSIKNRKGLTAYVAFCLFLD